MKCQLYLSNIETIKVGFLKVSLIGLKRSKNVCHTTLYLYLGKNVFGVKFKGTE